jgi:hypothetical protein
MKFFIHYSIFFLLPLILCSCTSPDEHEGENLRRKNLKGEYIYRIHDEYLFSPSLPTRKIPEPYPWEIGSLGKHSKITKEYFRCKGTNLNTVQIIQQNGETVRYYDCGGTAKHSLPLKDKKEYIYPILIDLMNYIQTKTGKKVVITCGHRCPEHNLYADPAPSNQHSKHMIGAEVSFYVQGMEDQPETVIKMIQDYYKIMPKYAGKKDFEEFLRYEKEDTNVSTFPWYNKEIFIKLFKKKEGRNFDNRHPYPYISLQVRWDEDTEEKIIYTWDKATHNYMRW